MKRWWLIVLIACLSLGCYILVWPPYYRQSDIRMRVADQKTGQPLAGAAVAAEWELHQIPFYTSNCLRVADAVTDANGMFTLRGSTARRPLFNYLGREDPTLYIYKPGYRLLIVDNNPAYVEAEGEPSRSWWSNFTRPPFLRDGRHVAQKYPGWSWPGINRFCFWNGLTVGLQPSQTVADDQSALTRLAGEPYLENRTLSKFWMVWREGYERLSPADRSAVAQPGVMGLAEEPNQSR